MNKIFTVLMLGLLLINFGSALDTLKPAKLNENYTVLQICVSCSFVNISITNVNGIMISNAEMVSNGSGMWTYNIVPTIIGRHDVTGVGDLDGTNTGFAAHFEVTSSGLVGTLGFYFIILILAVGMITLGFLLQDGWIVIQGGFALILVGLFTMFYGIDGMKDTVYTWGLGIIILMLGAYFSARAGIETIQD